VAASFDCDLRDGQAPTVELCHRAAGQIDFDRLDHRASPEVWLGPASPKQHLVDVVVDDDPEVLEVAARERPRELFGQRVADRVGMAETLPLDDLDRSFVDGMIFEGSRDELHRSLLGRVMNYSR
jgi:hypothetical protein